MTLAHRTPSRSDGGGRRPAFGAHVSVAGGLHKAFATGQDLGCECLQIFVRNQRQWRAPPLEPDQVKLFEEAWCTSGIESVVAHASYLFNLASPPTATRRRSVRGMVDELERCEALGVSSLIVHPGSHMDGTLESGLKRIARSLDEVHGECAGFRAMVLLEVTAGQGTSIGSRFEELGRIVEQTKEPQRLGVCLDTCHLFAAGYDFRSAKGYAAMVEELDGTIGLSNVKCIHVNDSKRECGSRVDRHEHIGKGKIGKAAFAHFVNDSRFADVPFILETPKGQGGRGTDLDKVNLKRLRALFRADGA